MGFMQIEYSVEEVTELVQETGLTVAELFNTALSLLKWAAIERKKGRIICSVDETSYKYKEIRVEVLEGLAPKKR